MGCVDACCNAIREGTLRFLNLILFVRPGQLGTCGRAAWVDLPR